MTELPEHLRRALEIAYSIEGVTGARVWELDDGTVAVAVRPSPLASPLEIVRRADKALDALRAEHYAIDVGLLDDAEA